MLEYQAYGCQKKAGEESVKGKRFVQMPINSLRSPPSKGELANKWLHNIGTSHTVETFNFNRKMVCQDNVTVDMEHRLPGLGERRLLNEAAVPTEFVHRTKSSGPKRRVGVAREKGSRKRDELNVCKYYIWGTRISFNVFPLL